MGRPPCFVRENWTPRPQIHLEADDFLPFSKDFFSESSFPLETWDGLCIMASTVKSKTRRFSIC